MTHFLERIFLVVAVLFFPRWALAQPPDPSSGDYTVLLVGGSHGDGATPALQQLEARLKDVDPKRAVVVFTGNYSAQALPPENEPGRAQIEREILAHVTATQDFVARGGTVYFLPGHRDFPDQGTPAVRRLRKFLNRSFEAAGAKAGLDVMPNSACGTPLLVDLTDKVGLLLINSQWWMQEPDGDPALNEGCATKTGRAFYEDLTDALREYRDRRLVVASHHPLVSYGEFGGAFGPAAHFSPAPLVGTASVFARQSGLVPQYLNYPRVRSYVELLHDEAETNGAYLFASGHDGNLQYLGVDQQTQVISGSSALVGAPTTRPGNGEFAAASPGWAELVFEPSGAGSVRFSSPDGSPLFAQQLPAVTRVGQAPEGPAAPFPEQPVAAAYSSKPVWQLPGVVRFFTGSYYSEAYTLKLPYPLLDLTREEGGLTPVRLGGGIQTKSLRLVDERGGEWSMRSTTKDASRLPPYPWNKIRPLERAIDYGYTASHPEAALAVPPLAAAVGVLHPEPRLMYLPDQEALGEYRGLFGDELVLLEQRAHVSDEGELPENFGGRPAGEEQPRIKQYNAMVEAVLEDPATQRVDQEAMLRARLLDMVIGDWDRHRGQWRFAATKGADGITQYVPIALDRDQAFGQYDAAGLDLAKVVLPRARSLNPFNAEYGNVAWFNYNARDVDPFVLNRIPHDRWMAIAEEVKAALTDQVIDEAMKTWRPETYALDGARIAEALKVRSATLPQAAEAYYAVLSKNVDVLGSAGDDVFDLWFRNDGGIEVAARAREPGSRPYYERTFHPSETAELRLYALQGNDLLAVHGTPHRQMAIGFVGGEGQDTVLANGPPPGTVVDAPAIRVFDQPDGARIDPNISVKDERSVEARLNQYEPEAGHEPNYGFFLPMVTLTSGSENWIGGSYTHVFPGFKKEPFASSHQLTALLATQTFGVMAEYRGLFPESLAMMDQQLDVHVQTPSYTRNFYGLTNT
ncbi:MAG: metallophosphoesterase [Myxococcaceae bacterium]|nr:metallophosphoesterase [Myxococcaceae bacterium]